MAMVISSVVRSSGSRVRSRADFASCASRCSRSRCCWMPPLIASQAANASTMVTSSVPLADRIRSPSALETSQRKVFRP